MTVDWSGRDCWASKALAEIPKLLTLQDRNPHSPTYGCFDRNFWHLRIVDFPSGMAQEFVWPLALVHELDAPNNPFRGSDAIREWVEAGMHFAMKSSHSDGSCDDYFPYERATGATAFSLLACLESFVLLGMDNPELFSFFERRAKWLSLHRESGRLSNHEALIVTCLIRIAQITGDERWSTMANGRLRRLLSWQSREGWFFEYEGCDPGYLTLTISLLSMIDSWRSELELREPIRKAVQFAAEFIHPDGTFGGEYGSRNTYNFFPHGFELTGKWFPEALAVNDQFVAGVQAGREPCYSDDHIVAHHTWNYLLAWRDYCAVRPERGARPEGRRWFPEAGLLIDRREAQELYVSTRKGGVFKFFRDNHQVLSDTHLSFRMVDGRAAVAHLFDQYSVDLADAALTISGEMGWAKQTQLTVFRSIVLRCIMLTIGRIFPNLVRFMLQKLLIHGKSRAPLRFERRLRWASRSLEIEDKVIASSWATVVRGGIGGHQTSVYVVMSRVFSIGQLQPWVELTPTLRRLREGEALYLKRVI